MKNKTLYVLDSSTLIFAKNFYPPFLFPTLWDIIEQKCEEGIIISSREVLEELERGEDDFIFRWAKKHIDFKETTEEIQKEVINILHDFPNLVKIKQTDNSNADPFLIAVAKIHNGTVVTMEKLYHKNADNPKMGIPYVCENYRIKWLGIIEFLNEIGIKY